LSQQFPGLYTILAITRQLGTLEILLPAGDGEGDLVIS